MLYDDYMWFGKTDQAHRYWVVLRAFWAGVIALVDGEGIWRTNRVFADIRVGVHPENARQSSGVVTPFMIERLRWAAEMEQATGHAAAAREWLAAAHRMTGLTGSSMSWARRVGFRRMRGTGWMLKIQQRRGGSARRRR